MSSSRCVYGPHMLPVWDRDSTSCVYGPHNVALWGPRSPCVASEGTETPRRVCTVPTCYHCGDSGPHILHCGDRGPQGTEVPHDCCQCGDRDSTLCVYGPHMFHCVD